MLDESRYLDLAHDAFRRIMDAFDHVDIDDADIESAGDVVTITWRGGSRCIVNTQRPVRQIWLAGGDRAWHFRYDTSTRAFSDDKGSGASLEETIEEIARQHGVQISIPRATE